MILCNVEIVRGINEGLFRMGETKFLLFPGMFICQLIIEEVRGCPIVAPNQFKGQDRPAGVVK